MALPIAVMTYRQNSAGSLSRLSNESQATAGGPAVASDSVSNVVFPKPAGADTTVSGAAPIRSASRGRAIAAGRRPGMRYLLSSSAVTTAVATARPSAAWFGASSVRPAG